MVESERKYYQLVLEQELARRQQLNPRFSLRSFARYLEIDSSTLSAILNGRRALPLSRAHAFACKMGLSGETLIKFRQSCEVEHTRLAAIEEEAGERYTSLRLDDDIDSRILIHWEYFAIFAFLGVCESDGGAAVAKISQRLFLDEEITRSCLEDLCQKRLVEKLPDGRYRKSCGPIHTRGIKEKDEVFREAHRSNLTLLIDRFDSFKAEESMMVSSTIAFDVRKLPQVRKLITEFQKKLSSFMREGQGNQVYQFMAYLFPISKRED
ncbi:MAG: hypothetical protein A2X86_03540 [Bdellovibrionales bacterium GWA2_49_15]|nr:MAG: hypothetical protein A2X86_03540 [Bdellovibrionales bacterium GWA2_49_15]